MQHSAHPLGISRRPGAFASALIGIVCAVALLALSGCHTQRSDTAHGGPEAPAGHLQTYQLKGIVVSSDPGTGRVSIDSEAIPGFMQAMIMPYKLAQPNIAGELHPGDHIVGRLLVSNSESLLDQIVVTAQAMPDYKPAIVYNVPEAGQEVPNFRFLNQSGKTIDIHQFHGKVLLVTFIYTRCPLPDFCVRMSRNFAEIDHALARDPQLYEKTHLLSVSFDPVYDTPKVLRSYGGAYTGKYTQETFSHWDFAAPPVSELRAVEQFFNVGVSPGENHTLTHSLSTVVIAPDGTIAGWYPTNDWKPEDLLGKVKRILKRPHEKEQAPSTSRSSSSR